MNPLRAQFDALLAQYRRNLPQKLAQLEELFHAGQSAELRRELRDLVASAARFGVPQIGDAARAAEACLVENPDAAQRNEFGNRLSRLKKLGMELASTG